MCTVSQERILVNNLKRLWRRRGRRERRGREIRKVDRCEAPHSHRMALTINIILYIRFVRDHDM